MDEEDDDDRDVNTQAIPSELLNEQVIYSGFLLKRGEKRKTWKCRWVVLRASQMALYRNEKEYQLLNVLNVRDMHAAMSMDMKRIGTVICIVAPDRTWYFRARDQRETTGWLDALAHVRGQPSDTHVGLESTSPTSHESTAVTRLPPTRQAAVVTMGPVLSSSDDENDMEEACNWTMPNVANAQAANTMPLASPAATVTAAAQPQSSEEGGRIITQGYMLKQGNRRKQWRKRWFVLTHDALYYSRTHMDTRSRRRIDTACILDAMESSMPHAHAPQARTLPPGTMARLGFGHTMPQRDAGTAASELPTHNASSYYFQIVTTNRTYQLCVPTEDDEIQWLSALQTLLKRQRRMNK